MKTIITIILSQFLLLAIYAQNLEVEGRAKITVMDDDATSDSLVVLRLGGELARRHVSSLPDHASLLVEDLLDAGLQGIVKDIDGNVYKTIKIGTQVWMAENLRTTHYNDGSAIPLVADNTAWNNLTTPGYSWYANDSTTNAKSYGAVYNYYTVADTNILNVCPVGWEVPSTAEWTVLTDFLIDKGYGYDGSGSDIAKSMASNFGWTNSAASGEVGLGQDTNNSSGFAGVPGGFRYSDEPFFDVRRSAIWWSSTEFSMTLASFRSLYFNYSDVYMSYTSKGNGNSVRCLRD